MDVAAAAPKTVRWIVRTLEDAGYETWVVGGAVRDVLLGRPAGDWDFATRAVPEQIMAVFRRTVPIGVEHGTVGVLARDGKLYEVTTFRRDIETDGRHAVVQFADHIEDDLARRDFTFNAIAWHPLRGELLDPSGGVTDMEAGVLRTVGAPADRFAEDFLRVLRALRFSGQLGFKIEENTWRALCEEVPRLHLLSAERVQEEIMKVLSQAERPSVALRLYARSGALAELLPELAEAVDSSAFDRTLEACDAARRSRPLVRLATLLSPLARGSGDAHAVLVAVESLLGRLRFSNADARHVASLVAARTFGSPSPGSADVRRWLRRVGPALFPDLARVWAAEARAGLRPVDGSESSPTDAVVARIRTIRAVLDGNPPLDVSDLALKGEHLVALGLEPGPRFGEIFSLLLEHVLERPEANTRAELEQLLRDTGWLTAGAGPSGGSTAS